MEQYPMVIIDKDSNRVTAYAEERFTWSPSREICVEDATIDVQENKLIITGNKKVMGSFMLKKWLAPNEVPLFEEDDIKYGYMDLWDRIKGIKSPFLQGWSEFKHSEPFSWESTTYTLIRK